MKFIIRPAIWQLGRLDPCVAASLFDQRTSPTLGYSRSLPQTLGRLAPWEGITSGRPNLCYGLILKKSPLCFLPETKKTLSRNQSFAFHIRVAALMELCNQFVGGGQAPAAFGRGTQLAQR